MQATVISEGANLGITQLGRIEYEAHGDQINTDAIDNSAGVNMSDYEVNIKILLSLVPSLKNRNEILEKATDEVTQLVLNNNIEQHNLISMDQYRCVAQSFYIEDSINHLIKEGRLSISDEQIPSLKERNGFYQRKQSLPRCVLAKCQAYTKMKMKAALQDSKYFESSIYDDIFYHYFPKSIQKYIQKKQEHRLKNQIIITQLTNYYVGLFGCSSIEKITFRNKLSLDKAIHQLCILEDLFEFKTHRENHYNESIPNHAQIVALNDTLLHCNFICTLLNIPLDAPYIHDYKTKIRKYTALYEPSILCILMSFKDSEKVILTLNHLESTIHILSHISLLFNLPVTNKTDYQERFSIVSDLLYSLHECLTLPTSTIESIKDTPSLKKISPDGSNHLSLLFLYSFELRHFVKTIQKKKKV